jgi:hypothetical protein
MTLEEYQAELRRISDTLAEQHRDFDQVSAVLRDYPDLVVRIDPEAFALLEDSFRVLTTPVPSLQGVRC